MEPKAFPREEPISQSEEIAQLLARIAGLHGLPPVALVAMASDRLTASGHSRPGEALLERKARDFLALTQRLSIAVDDTELHRLRAEAAAAMTAGRLSEADKALAKAELHLIGEASNLSALSTGKRLRIGENRADRAALSFLRMTPETYREAATRYGEAAMLIGGIDSARSRRAGLDQARALARISEDFGGSDGYEAAADRLRRLLPGLDGLEDAVTFAEAADALSEALDRLTGITGDKALQGEALTHCRRGLMHLQRDEAPLLWRALKLRLGRLALLLGSGQPDEALLEEAISAFATALAGWDRQDDEERWLEAEHMIAIARLELGGHRGDLALLERAFNGFDRVVRAFDRAREPLRWAELQDQMGSVLVAMSERYSEPVILEEAIGIFAAALEERRRDTAPRLWARSSANQAEAVLKLARRIKDKNVVPLALEQMKAALEVARRANDGPLTAELQKRLAAAGELAQQVLAA